MPLQKIALKPGVNRENTRYTNEGGWYESEKIRFRQGTPEKLGGWQAISGYTYEGVCRSLWNWSLLSGTPLIGVGTNLKFYIEQGLQYYDITPVRAYATLSGPFSAIAPQTFTVTVANPAVLTASTLNPILDGTAFTFTTTGALPTGLSVGTTYYAVNSSTNTCQLSLTKAGATIQTTGTQSGTHTLSSVSIKVTDSAHGSTDGDFVTFSGAVALSTQTYTANASTDFITFTTALAADTPVNLFTTSNFPTGLTGSFTYYVVNQSGATCQLATVPGGAPINITSAGVGTQTLCVATGMTASVLNNTYQITYIDANTYIIYASTSANVYDTGAGGTNVLAAYDIPTGPEYTVPLAGWGAGGWGYGAWGYGVASTDPLRNWNQNNWGQDLLFGPVGGAIYYWNASLSVSPNIASITAPATPGVVTYTSASLPNGTAIVFTTTGALPTGLTVGTVYYVVGSSGTTFNVSATYGGAAIATTGTQSGTHYIQTRGIPISALGGISDYPLTQNFFMVSDASRFLLVFGTNDTLSTEFDPMLIRWSEQESLTEWTPSITNQAGSIRLSHGSTIVTALQVRQEIIVWTDTALYSLQYLGAPYVWGSQLLSDNISIISPKCAVLASGVVYWMSVDKFYRYDGRVSTLNCDLLRFVFNDINKDQYLQVFAGTNEGFNEVWWFYCSTNSTVVDRYVIYNYVENCWYYGTMGRTAWLDSSLDNYPVAASYYKNLVYHEYGLNDAASGTAQPMESYIVSSQYDIGDGNNFGFVWRLLPDVTFNGSTAANPQITMTLLPLQNSGSGYNNPLSVGGNSNGAVVSSAVVPVDQFTGQVNIRVRGRQMSMKVESNQLNTQWQLGSARIDIRPDGRR